MYPNLDRPKGVQRIRRLLNKYKKEDPNETKHWPATGFIIELLVICLNNSYDQFHHYFHNSTLFNLRFSRCQNCSFQNGISPIVFECHCKT